MEEATTVREAYRVLRHMMKEKRGDETCVVIFPPDGEIIEIENQQLGPVSTLGTIFHQQNGFKKYINCRARAE